LDSTNEPTAAPSALRCSPSHDKVSKVEIRRHFELCVNATAGLNSSDDSFVGFLVGFRLYERMARKLGRELTEDEVRQFVAVK
jgi:hypothetical protein